MDDSMIVDLFFERSEEAIGELDNKYGRYCKKIAYGILGSDEDSEECVNDGYLAAWNSIPPAKPERLGAYVGKIVRNLALNRQDSMNAEKRRPDRLAILDEVEEFTPDPGSESGIEEIVIKDILDRFLSGLPKNARIIFVRRYWHMNSIREISEFTGVSENNVKVTLSRTRKKLKSTLEKEGYTF